MPYNKPMDPVQARVMFKIEDVEPGILTLPTEVVEALKDTTTTFRKVEYNGFLIVGQSVRGCQEDYERYYVVIDDLSKGIPHWLREVKYEVRIHEDGGFAIPLSISFSPLRGNNTVDIKSPNWALALAAHQALASLTSLTYCEACGKSSNDPLNEGHHEPGRGWHCFECHRRLFDDRT